MVYLFISLVGLAASLVPVYPHHNALAACNGQALGDPCSFKINTVGYTLSIAGSKCIEDPYPTYVGNLPLVCDLTQGSAELFSEKNKKLIGPSWVTMGREDYWNRCWGQFEVMRILQKKFDLSGMTTLNEQARSWCEVQFQDNLGPDMLCSFSHPEDPPLHPNLKEHMQMFSIDRFLHVIPPEALIDGSPTNVDRDIGPLVEHLHLPCLGKTEGDSCSVTLDGREKLTISKSKCVYRTSTGFIAPNRTLICDDFGGPLTVDGEPLGIGEDQGTMNLREKMIAYCAEDRPSKPRGYCSFRNWKNGGVRVDCVEKRLADVTGSADVLDNVDPVNFYSYDGTKFSGPAMAFSELAKVGTQIMETLAKSANFGLIFGISMVVILLGSFYLLWSLLRLWQNLRALDKAFIQRYGDLANTPYF